LFLALALFFTWRPAPPLPPPPTAPPPEAELTNLIHRAGFWWQKANGRTNLFAGVMVAHYPGGLLMSRSVVSNGQLSGLSEGWFTNRQMQIQEYYRNNVSDGLRKRWYPNGQKMSEATIVRGTIQGTFRRWHINGKPAEEISMRDGRPDGVGRVYYESGCLKEEIELHAGKEVHRTSYKDGERPGDAGGWATASSQK
jgi:antitoxin component YwqK of YwqJK toxin-antitoxin module